MMIAVGVAVVVRDEVLWIHERADPEWWMESVAESGITGGRKGWCFESVHVVGFEAQKGWYHHEGISLVLMLVKQMVENDYFLCLTIHHEANADGL